MARGESLQHRAAVDDMGACTHHSDMRIIIALALTISGCAGTFGDKTVMHANHLAGAATVASLAVDWCGTRSAASAHWHGTTEAGYPTVPMIGTTPSTRAVDVYFAAATLTVLAIAQLTPRRVRPALYAGVVAYEAMAIAGNLRTTNCMGIGRE